jgi:hypothetical protein
VRGTPEATRTTVVVAKWLAESRRRALAAKETVNGASPMVAVDVIRHAGGHHLLQRIQHGVVMARQNPNPRPN